MKVLQFTIPVPGENNIIVRHDLQPYFYQYLHRHDEIQLTWILKGEGTLVVDNNMYPFKSNEIYCTYYNDNPKMYLTTGMYLDTTEDNIDAYT